MRQIHHVKQIIGKIALGLRNIGTPHVLPGLAKHPPVRKRQTKEYWLKTPMAKPLWHRMVDFEHLVSNIAGVASEKLVAAVASQQSVHTLFTGQLGAIVGWHG